MKKETIFRYEMNYRKAEAQAQTIAESIIKKHPDLEYNILTAEGEGVFVRLFGDEAKVRQISASMRKKELKLLLAGTPVYIIFGGKKKVAANSHA